MEAFKGNRGLRFKNHNFELVRRKSKDHFSVVRPQLREYLDAISVFSMLEKCKRANSVLNNSAFCQRRCSRTVTHVATFGDAGEFQFIILHGLPFIPLSDISSTKNE